MLDWRYVKSLPKRVKTTAVKIVGLTKWILDDRELVLTADGMLHLLHPDNGVQLNVWILDELWKLEKDLCKLLFCIDFIFHSQTFRANSILLSEDKESFTVTDSAWVW